VTVVAATKGPTMKLSYDEGTGAICVDALGEEGVARSETLDGRVLERLFRSAEPA
jgi:hypothetical protein